MASVMTSETSIGPEQFYPPSLQPTPTPSLTSQGFSELAYSGDDRGTSALLPPDQGYAWVFLAAAFTIEMLVWGYGFSVGVFHQYWSTYMFPGAQSSATLALAATLLTGLMYLDLVAYGPLLTRYPEYRAAMQYAGLVVSVIGIIGSAFATKPWHLIVTAGIFYPLGGGIVYLPTVTLVFEWFAQKKGLAGGIMYSGTGIGGALFPFIIQSLLDRFSYKTAVISLALGYLIPGALAIYFIRERVPVPRRNAASGQYAPRRKVPLSFVKRNAFWWFCATILSTSLGNFLPSLYLPSYAAELGLSDNKGTLLVAVMNAASVAGLITLGYFSDRWPTRVVVAISCLGSSLSCLLLWGFGTSLGVLIVFAIAFGFFALSFAAVWTKLITIVARDDPLLPSILMGIFSFSRGLGNILSGPISNALLAGGRLQGAKFGYGVGAYGSLLLYTGGIIGLGAITGVSYREKTD